jgi:hypothetical protein
LSNLSGEIAGKDLPLVYFFWLILKITHMPTFKFFTRTKATHDKLTPVYCRFKAGRQIDMTAKSEIKVQPEKKVHKVQKGESLSDIAKKYDITVGELKQANKGLIFPNHSEALAETWLTY